MEGDIFKSLCDFGFKKEFKIDNCDFEIRYIWEHTRDKTHPHGKVRIYASDTIRQYHYGTDDAGSNWIRFGCGKWELLKWAE